MELSGYLEITYKQFQQSLSVNRYVLSYKDVLNPVTIQSFVCHMI